MFKRTTAFHAAPTHHLNEASEKTDIKTFFIRIIQISKNCGHMQ